MIQGKLCDHVTTDAGAVRYEFSTGTVIERVDPTLPLGTYKTEARWHHRPSQSYYFARIREGFTTVEKLGKVWTKNDGRWNWLRHGSRFQIVWKAGQGVVMTKAEAILEVEKGWNE